MRVEMPEKRNEIYIESDSKWQQAKYGCEGCEHDRDDTDLSGLDCRFLCPHTSSPQFICELDKKNSILDNYTCQPHNAHTHHDRCHRHPCNSITQENPNDREKYFCQYNERFAHTIELQYKDQEDHKQGNNEG